MKSLLLIGVALAACLASDCPAAAALNVGDDAPDFELQASDGNTYKLSDFKGKQAVVIAWFPKAFTPGCTAECKSLRDEGQAIRHFDVAYFAASTDPIDGPKGNKAFAESLHVDYPILSDPKGEAAKAFGIYHADRKAARRVTFYITKDGRIGHVEEKVDTAAHGAQVVDALKHLGVPQRN